MKTKCKLCGDKKKVWRYITDEAIYDHPPRPVLVPCPKCVSPPVPTFPMPRPKKELPN